MLRAKFKPARTVLFSTLTPTPRTQTGARSVLDRVFRPQPPLNHLNHLHLPITHTHARPKSPARTSQPNPRVKPPTSIMNTPSTLISTPSALASLLTTLTSALSPNPSTPSLYIDPEGVNLCRHGTTSLLTAYVLPLGHVYLIDVHTLASLAFTTPCPCTGATLGSLLALPTVPKGLLRRPQRQRRPLCALRRAPCRRRGRAAHGERGTHGASSVVGAGAVRREPLGAGHGHGAAVGKGAQGVVRGEGRREEVVRAGVGGRIRGF